MSDDDVRLEPQVLRSCAGTWFPRMTEATASAGSCVLDGRGQVGAAFADPADRGNGAAWTRLADTFADTLTAAAARLKAAQAALHLAADSYEDTDGNSALRIEATS